jgi:hypothetical protein
MEGVSLTVQNYAALSLKEKNFLGSDEPFHQFFVWVVMDSNHRRQEPADLQSAPFGHSGNYPLLESEYKNNTLS